MVRLQQAPIIAGILRTATTLECPLVSDAIGIGRDLAVGETDGNWEGFTLGVIVVVIGKGVGMIEGLNDGFRVGLKFGPELG